MSNPDVLVIGAGVVGVTTAYYLAQAGYSVQVIDKNSQAADECSFANGGFLSLGHAVPWAQPGITKIMLQSLWDPESPARWRFDGSLLQMRWLWEFYKNSSAQKYAQNKQALYNLAAYSKGCLKTILDQHAFVPTSPKGVLQISRYHDQVSALEKQHASYQGTLVRSQLMVNKAALAQIDSAFSHSEPEHLCGIFINDDYSADCRAFTQSLASYLEDSGVRFSWGVTAQAIRSTSQNATVHTASGELRARYVVICAGVGSELLLTGNQRPFVYPVKGYAMTVPVTDAARAPVHPVVDGDTRVAISRFNNDIRLTAVAEIVGHNKNIEPKRIAQMQQAYERLFPGSVNWSQASKWVGFRPTRPSAVPVIGPLRQENVFVNTGHGAYGWTLACGSAKLLTHQLDQQPTEIPHEVYLNQS